MNLFNIGVEGQYRVATFAAAVFAGEALLPGYLNTVVAILVAMAAGALWAGHRRAAAGDPRRQRGHLDDHAERDRAVRWWRTCCARSAAARARRSAPTQIPERQLGRRHPAGPGRAPTRSTASALLAVVAGVGFAVLLNRTRFGFDLRATGQSESAAVASGVNVKRMVVYSMLLSGAVAGLIGMPELFGELPRVRVDDPDRHRLHRHRGRAARPQQPGRASPSAR